MRFATFDGEKEIRTLVQRLYDIRDRGSAERFRRAEEALLAANPVLEDFSRVKIGTILRVPEVATVRSTSEIQPLGSAVNAAIQAAQRQLDGLEAALEKTFARQSDEAKKTLELSRSRVIQNLAEKEPLLKQQIPEIRKTVEARLTALEKLKISRKEGFGSLRNEFARLGGIGK